MMFLPVALLLFVGAAASNRRSIEPQCTSQFDYNHKLLLKMIQVEEEVKKFRVVIDEMNNLKHELEDEQKTKLSAALADFTKTSEAKLEKFKDDAADKLKSDTEEAINTFQTTTQKLINKPAVGFTVKGIKALPSSSYHATFSTVVSNIGDGYDLATGLFTCSQKGTYYFSASLLKAIQHTGICLCYIYKNSSQLVVAYKDLDGRTGYDTAVNSVYVHLNVGDTVKLAGCSDIHSSMHPYSSFSGFLITADVD